VRQQLFAETPQRVEGLYLTGNYTNGVSVANCIKSALDVAGDVAANLSVSVGDSGYAQQAMR